MSIRNGCVHQRATASTCPSPQHLFYCNIKKSSCTFTFLYWTFCYINFCNSGEKNGFLLSSPPKKARIEKPGIIWHSCEVPIWGLNFAFNKDRPRCSPRGTSVRPIAASFPPSGRHWKDRGSRATAVPTWKGLTGWEQGLSSVYRQGPGLCVKANQNRWPDYLPEYKHSHSLMVLFMLKEIKKQTWLCYLE